MRGGDRGPAIIPGKPEQSLLVKAVRYADDDLQMPPAGKLPDREIAALVEWVRRGAFDPRDGGPVRLGGMSLAEAKRFWSFQPVKRPDVPLVPRHRTVPGSPIDDFLDGAHGRREDCPLPQADKRTLDPPGDLRPHRPAASTRRKSRASWRTMRPTLLPASSIGCSPRPITARLGTDIGLTWCATPTRPARTPIIPCPMRGGIATG